MATTIASGLRSPPTPRSSAPSPRPSTAPSPRPTFDAELLKGYMKELLQSTLKNATWPEPRERDKVKAWIKEIGERVKKRMLDIQPQAFKYIVLTQINENAGQGGRLPPLLFFSLNRLLGCLCSPPTLFSDAAAWIPAAHQSRPGLPLGRLGRGCAGGVCQ